MDDNRTLGNYRLLRLIGEGGFARVYLGEHIFLKTYAALKVPNMALQGEELEGFLNEARTSIGLHHPHIVRTLECGVEGGTQPYIVMDYASGGSLRTRYPKGTPLPPSSIITYVKQAGSALQFIHDKGLIHQDIKPGNLLLGVNDDVLLSDFGLAMIVHRTISQSLQDMSGTARYMAPEQFRGKARPASDQYALAVMTYEWICGNAPFEGTLTELLTQHLYTSPPPLHLKVPSISPAVEQIILKALAKEPRDRFARVQDFVDALEQAGQPQRLASPSSPGLPAYPVSPAPISSPGLPGIQAGQPPYTPFPVPPAPISSPGLPAMQNEEEILTIESDQVPRLQRTAQPIPPSVYVEERRSKEDDIPTVRTGRDSSAALPDYQPTRFGQPRFRVPEPPTPLPEPLPIPPASKRPRLRRGMATLLIGLVVIVVAATVGFFTIPLFHGPGSPGITPTVPTQGTPSPPPPYSAMFGFNQQHTRYNPAETILSTANVAQLTSFWKAPTSSASSGIYSSPLVSNGLVYVTSSDNKLYAFSALTGKQQWEMATGNYVNKGSPIYSSPSILNGVVYVGSNDGRVYAFNATKGQSVWVSLPTGSSVFSSPTVVNGILYIGSTDHKVYALDATNGKQLWAMPTGGEVYSSPAVINNVVYIGSDDSKLYAFNATTGSVLWTSPILSHFDSSPTVVDGVVYIGGSDSKVYAFAATGCGHPTCNPLWTAATGGFINSSPAVANGMLYIGSHDNNLYAYDIVKCQHSPTTCSPLWMGMTGGGISSSPTVANGVVYIGSWDGKLYAFDAKTGAPLWNFPTGQPIYSSPTVLDGILYVGSNNNSLYAFHI